MNIFTRFFTRFFSNPISAEEIERDLIRREAEIGRTVFGPVPYGVKRDFFCLDSDTWVWHEERAGRKTVTHYKIRSNDLIKSVNGGLYEQATLEETNRFVEAVKTYTARVDREIYSRFSMV